MNEILSFLQQYGTALVLLSQVVVFGFASKFVLRTDHEAAVSSLDRKFNNSIDKVDKVEDRVATLEGEFRHLPDRGDVHRIQLSLTEMKGDLKALGEQLKPVASISERLQEFLLEQASK